MKKNVPPAHFGYMATGVDDEMTLRANREGFRKFALRPRRLVDVSKVDMRADILGITYDNPIVVAPTGSNRAFHPDAEIARAGGDVGAHDVDRWADAVGAEMVLGQPDAVVARLVHDRDSLERALVDRGQRHAPRPREEL